VWRRYGNYDTSTRNHCGRSRYDQHYDDPGLNYNSGIDNNDNKSADNDPAHEHSCRHHR